MERSYFLRTDTIGFSEWCSSDLHLAKSLWGNPQVTRFICASGTFTDQEIINRLNLEISTNKTHHIQYWPVFELRSGTFLGCCGLRPYKSAIPEIGFHFLPAFWGQGYAFAAANAVMRYAFTVLQADALFAGHNPKNIASGKVLLKLGFQYSGEEFYAPTGLFHPSYLLTADAWNKKHARQ